jgi:hypothetical protein
MGPSTFAYDIANRVAFVASRGNLYKYESGKAAG